MCPGHEPALECPKQQYAGKLEHGELGHKLYAAFTKKKLKKIRSEQDLNLRGNIPIYFEPSALTTRPSQQMEVNGYCKYIF